MCQPNLPHVFALRFHVIKRSLLLTHLLCSLEARAKAIGVTWKGALKDVNFSGCPAWEPHAATPNPLPQWADLRLKEASGDTVLSLAATTALSAVSGTPPDVILRGKRPGLPQLGLVFLQGAEVHASAYTPFLEAVQDAVGDFDVIVGVPSFDLSTPDPLTIGTHVDRVVHEMVAEAGLDNRTAKMVFAAHSLGGVFLQVRRFAYVNFE
jgi:hypothetical protein